MAQPTSPATFPALRNSILKGQLAPVYLIHGDEPYYTDELAKLFEAIVPESERDFNLYTLYSRETNPAQIADACRRYPMMAERLVVIVKEAQLLKSSLNALADYAASPVPTTVLAILCRGESVKAAKLISAIKASGGVIFESKKLNERSVDPAIETLAREASLSIDPKGTAMLRDYIGTDLSKLKNEIDKMAMILGPGATITPESIERHIGVSKDYNNFELIDAVAAHNAAKAFRIVDYFARNPKSNPTVVTVTALFNYFSNLLIYHFTPDKSPSSLLGALGLRWQGQLRPYETGARFYNAFKTIEIISAIRAYDANSKGIGSRQDAYALMRDLIFRILNAPGDISF